MDWPTWRQSNERWGGTAEVIDPAAEARWTYAAPAPPRPAWSTAEGRVIESLLIENRVQYDSVLHPIVVGDRVIFGSSVDHRLHCRDLKTGELHWSFVTGAPIRLAPTFDRGYVYFGSDDGYAYCLAAETGALVWRFRSGPSAECLLARGEMISRWPVRTGVLVENGLAYFGAGIFPHERVYIACLDAVSGEPVWLQDHLSELDAGRTGLSPQGYLLVDDERLYVASGRSLPVALDKKTGELIHARSLSWRSTAGGVVGGYQALLADGQIYASGDHHWVAMDQATGAAGYGWFEGRELVLSADDAFSATGSEVLKMSRYEYAVNSRRRQELRLRERELIGKIAAATEDMSQLTAELQKVRQELVDIRDIGVTWRQPCNHRDALLVTPNLLFVGGAGGVTAFAVADGRPMWSCELEGSCQGLVAAGGHLLVSTDAGQVVCFGPRGALPPTTARAEIKGQTEPFPRDELTDVYARAAEEILGMLDRTRGYCLVVDNQLGRLAYALASRSDLKVLAVDSSEERVAAARQALLETGFYGHRIVVHHVPRGEELPYSNYFADLIISDAALVAGQVPDVAHVGRHLKPLGGLVVLPTEDLAGGQGVSPPEAQPWLQSLDLEDTAQSVAQGVWIGIRRGALPGAGSWSHHYGTAANTAIGDEQRVKGELGILWYGDPGPGDMVNRHDGAVGPLATAGRLFVQGESTIAAYDAYNGTFLWRYQNPDAVRTGVFENQNPGNLVATDDRLLHFVRHQCFELDAASGDVLRVHRLPANRDDRQHEWGYVAVDEGLLFGTATVRQELEEKLRRRGKVTEDATDQLFAIDLISGNHVWSYQGQSISHHTVAIGDGKVFFVDSSITSEQRAERLQQDKTQLELLTGQERAIAEDRLRNADIRRAVALDARTGQEIWSHAVDVTDCSDIGIGGGRLTLMFHDGVLILGGANANGHFWKQFVAGEFSRRRLVALDATLGYQRWALDANYKGRPIVIGDRVVAEPWSFDLKNGQQLTRKHPITGEAVPWSLMRTGHHCGILTGCDSGLLLFRSGDTAFYDLESDAGVKHFSGHRLGCWINAIPANGLVMIPEASAGCVCQFSIASTVVLEPREVAYAWTIHGAVGPLTPVQAMRLNLGAPGDRRASDGGLWLSYPRRRAYKETSLDLALDLQPAFADGGRFQSTSRSPVSSGASIPEWVCASWAEGLQQLVLPLRGPEDPPAPYRLRLICSATAPADGATATLRIDADGHRWEKEVPIAPVGGGQGPPVIVELECGEVSRNLVLTMDEHQGRLRWHGLEVEQIDARSTEY